MANEFNIKNGFISNGNSSVNGLLTSQTLKITSGATNGYVLTSDASGNASWVTPTTDTNIYNTNGTLTNSRTVDLAGNSISFVDGFATSTFLFNSDDGNDAASISAVVGSISLGTSGGGTGKALSITTTQISLDGKFTVDSTKNTSGQNLEVNGQTKTATFQMTTSPTAGYVLTSDASGNATWSAPSSSSGKFGIANSGGTYTYYSTLTDAISAATAGQAVEFFTDYTESGNVTISMKDGVNINGNGHTYTCTYTGGAIAIFQNTTGTQTISDLTIVGTGMNSSSQGFLITYTAQKTFFNGVVVKMDAGFGAYVYGSATIDGLITNVTGSAKGFYVDSGTIINCNSYSVSGYAIQFINPSYGYNCYAYSLNTSAFYSNGGQLYDCVGNGGIGIELQGGNVYNCVGKSSTGYGIYVQPSGPSQVVNCTAISTASWGMFQYNNNSLISNCNILSTANYGIYTQFVGGNRYVNNYILSTSAIAFRSVASGINNLYNNTIHSSWNNSGGHAIEVSVSNDVLIGNILEVANTSANCLYGGSAYTTKYSDTKFVGATTPVNANITQGMTNTEDAYGNITI